MEDIIPFPKCTQCMRKIRPPFEVCENSHQVCRYCHYHQNAEVGCSGKIISTNVIDQLFLNAQDFCQYDCGYKNTLAELENHENRCQKEEKSINCIIPECNWLGKLNSLLKHFEEDHPLALIDLSAVKVSFHLSIKHSVLLLSQFSLSSIMNELYSLKLSISEEKRRISIEYLGNIGRKDGAVKIFEEFVISPSNNNNLMIVASVTENREEATDITILNDDLYNIKLINPIKSLLPESISSMFECVVCAELMQAPIKLCETGHSFCGKCALKMQFCPMCNKNIMEARNYCLEQVIEKLHITCPNSACGVTGLRQEIQEHLKKCEYQIVNCFAMCQNDKVYRCIWSGCFKDFLKHWEDDHKDAIKNNGSVFTSCWWYTYLYPIKDQFFVFTYVYNHENYYFSIHHINRDKETEYKFDIKFSHPVTGRSIAFSGDCMASNFDDLINNDYLRNCVNVNMIPLDWMNTFIRQKKTARVTMKLNIFQNSD